MRLQILALVLVGLAEPVAQDRPLPDYATFAAQVKLHLATDEERQTGYMFIEKRIEQKLDASGQPHGETVKVFEVYPGLPGEDRYLRLIQENGVEVSPETLDKRDRERQKAVQAYARKVSTSAGRLEDKERRRKERKEFQAAVDDLFHIYDIRMVHRESIDGRETILATLTPRADAKPQTDDGKIMRHFKARAWISESDYELVRVEIEAIDDLSFGWGFFARVHRGATATYQRRKVNDEIWLPEKVTWTGNARILLVKPLRVRGVAEFSAYRKFAVDTTTTFSKPSLP